jgi:hypothetical protein
MRFLSHTYVSLLILLVAAMSGAACLAGTVQDWIQNSGLICVATCTNCGDAPDYQYSSYATYKSAVWTFSVNSPLKVGETFKSFLVQTYDLDKQALFAKGITTYSLPSYFTSFSLNRTYLLFLSTRKTYSDIFLFQTGQPAFELTNPYDGVESALLLPVSYQNQALSQDGNLELNLLDVTLTTLDSQIPSERAAGLRWLGEFGVYMDQNRAYSPLLGNPTYGLNRAKDGVVPPAANDNSTAQAVCTAIQSVALPKIEAMLDDTDVGVQDASIITLGCLQQSSIIPKLIALATSDSREAWRARSAISMYATDSSATALAPYLTSPDPKLREAIGASLVTDQDPELLPALVAP